MEGHITLNAAEACEAMRAYLVLRGALPKHGTVRKVKQGSDRSYSSGADIECEVVIGDEPVNTSNMVEDPPNA